MVSNAPQVLKWYTRQLEWITNVAKENEKRGVFTFKVPLMPRMIITTKPENIQHFLRDNFKNYDKGQWFHGIVEDLLGDGIFNADGEKWHAQRKTAANLFSANSFRELIYPTFERHGHMLRDEISQVCKSGAQIDIHSLYHRFTLDSIGEIAFGLNIGSLKDPSMPFARAFDGAQAIVDKRVFNPLWKLMPFSADELQIKANVKTMNEFCYNLIEQRRVSGEYKNLDDVLSRFMQMNEKWAAEEGAGKGVLYSDKYLRDVVLNFVIAGRDTTAQALSWTSYLLSQHPEVERRMRAEMWEVLGEEHAGPDYDSLRNMPYTTAVVRETLRLYPSVPKDSKEAQKDDVWPDGTKVPAGSLAIYVPYSMGRLTSVWGPDAEEFKPQRMLDDPKPSMYKYTVFQAGPRMCLGMNMAILEAVNVLCFVYKRHTLKVTPGQVIEPMQSLTLPMKNGMNVSVHEVPRP